MSAMTFAQPLGEGWVQIGYLALAFVLSALIGLERELRQKSAGLRTHTIVGVASALIMLVSKYGFTDVLGNNVNLDPSRVAAQIVSGIGFIGGGLIFVRRDSVRGLTTAAIVWLTAAVGMAAGAGLPILAVLVTGAHFIVVYGFTPLAARLPRSKYAPSQLSISYLNGQGVLRQALAESTERGFTVSRLSTKPAPERSSPTGPDHRHEDEAATIEEAAVPETVSVILQVQGRGSVTDLAAALSEIGGMVTVDAADANTTSE